MTGDEREEGKLDAPPGREATNPSNKNNSLKKISAYKVFGLWIGKSMLQTPHKKISLDFSNPFNCPSRIHPFSASQSHMSSSKSQSGLAGD